MERKGRQRRQRRHETRQLKQIIGNDLMTWREKFIKNETYGLYSLADEQAYCANSEDKSEMTVPEFERLLKTKVHENFIVVYNPTITAKHDVEGHSIYFFVDAYGGYIPLCKVGRSAVNEISANSLGGVIDYKGKAFNNSGLEDQSAVLSRGWVAALKACELAFKSWEREGIDPRSVITPQEAAAMKRAYSIVGFSEQVLDTFKDVPTIEVDGTELKITEETTEETEETTEETEETTEAEGEQHGIADAGAVETELCAVKPIGNS